MTIYETAIEKIQQLPESLVQEVCDFIDFLQLRSKTNRWQLFLQLIESFDTTESDFTDYLKNLEEYEDRLARGEIQW
ncbi:MAG: DUF2281 domain-containing protein [Candidatus Tectomicrobia bacterium]|nr:DUF2281 domain-containing protein [Candidatus Tectomicrobia bacterium]